jgi:hypothetical protein
MPNNAHLFDAIQAAIAQISINSITMPTGDPRLGGDRRAPGAARIVHTPILVQITNEQIHEVESPIIHDPATHIEFWKGGRLHTGHIESWIRNTKGILKLNGLKHMEESNYFYNGNCGIYIEDNNQIVIYRDPFGTCTYETNTPVIYHLIGFLVLNKLIPINFITSLDDSLVDKSDTYEF